MTTTELSLEGILNEAREKGIFWDISRFPANTVVYKFLVEGDEGQQIIKNLTEAVGKDTKYGIKPIGSIPSKHDHVEFSYSRYLTGFFGRPSVKPVFEAIMGKRDANVKDGFARAYWIDPNSPEANRNKDGIESRPDDGKKLLVITNLNSESPNGQVRFLDLLRKVYDQLTTYSRTP